MTKYFRLLFITAILQLFTLYGYSQTFLFTDDISKVIEADEGIIHDDGGSLGNYSNSFDGTITLKPVTAGKKIALHFTSFDLESCCDKLTVYNGLSSSNEQIGVYTSSPGVIYSTDDSGALTLVFHTDGSVTRSGFDATFSVVDEVPAEDLAIVNMTLNTDTIVAGSTLNVSNIIQNSSSKTFYNHRLVYYLSTDTIFDSSDDSLTYNSIYSIYSNSTRTVSDIIYTDINTPNGVYYLFSRIVDQNMNSVGDSINDLAFEPIYFEEAMVDLQFVSVDLNRNRLAYNSPLVVDYSLRNEGNTNSGTSYTGYYLSVDMVLDDADSLLYSAYCPSITQQSNYSRSNTIYIDAESGYTTGIYYLIIKTDYQDIVEETEESNNLFVTQVLFEESAGSVNPVITSITPKSDSISEGSGFMVEYNFDMEGYASNIGVRLFISEDDVLDYNEDNVLRSFTVTIPNGISTSEWYSSIQNIESLGIDYGLNYLIAEIDYTNVYPFEDTTDNIVSHPIYIMPTSCFDLELKNFEIVTDSILNGQSVYVEGTVENTCYSRVSGLYIGYYLSDDELFDAGDDFLSNSYINNLYPGDSYSFQKTININNHIPADYNIISVVDYHNYIIETDEQNNVLFDTLKIISNATVGTLDIELSDVRVPELVEKDEVFQASIDYFLNDTLDKYVSFACYLSTDSIFDLSDIEYKILSSSFGSKAYQKVTRNFSISIPDSIITEKVYLVFKIDDHNVLFEENEQNNIIIQPINLEEKTYYTQVVWNGVSVPSVVLASGAKVTGTYSMYNTGNTSADTIIVKAYIAEETGGNLSSGFTVVDTLYNLTGIMSNQEFEFFLPDTLVDGVYYINLVAEVKNIENVSDFSSGFSQLLIGIQTPVIDYTITELSLNNNQIYQGVLKNINYTVVNQGTNISQTPEIGFYLSLDDTYSLDDTQLITSLFNCQGIQAPTRKSIGVEIPNGTTPGDYYIIALVDPANEINETVENNNSSTLSVEVLPSGVNFILSDTRLNLSEVKVGSSVSWYGTISNIGNEASSPTRIGIFISNDTIWDTSDQYVAYDYISSINPGASRSAYTTLYPVNTLTAGSYYIIAKADYLIEQEELVEDDNSDYIALEVLSLDIDLEFERNTLDTLHVVPGATLNVLGEMKNIGSDYLRGHIYSSFYLSADTILNPIEDSYLGEDNNYVNLSAHDSEIETYTYSVPSSINYGIYYGFMEVDNPNDYKEVDESNNLIRFPIRIVEPNIDLLIDNISLSQSTVSSGEYISSEYHVYNQGTTASDGRSYSAVYLSDDEVLSIDDNLSISQYASSILAGDYVNVSRNIYIPTNLGYGTYYLLFIADNNDDIDEVNEQNNIVSRMITITEPSVDLSVRNITTSMSIVTPGNQIYLSSEVQNEGASSAQHSSYLGYYLSKDEVLNSLDTYLGEDYVGNLSSGGYSYESLSFNLPTVASGEYYILFVADYKSSVDEVNELNNISSQPLTVLPYVSGIDYVVSGVSHNIDNGNLELSVSISNVGNSNSSTICFSNIVLSKDGIFDENDYLLTSYTVFPLDGQNRVTNLLYERMPLENYNYLFIVIDENNDLIESNKENNYYEVLINENMIDIAIEGPTNVEDTPADGEFEILSTIVNNSDTALFGLQLEYYISSDTILGTEDILAHSRMVSFLSPLEELPIVSKIDIPGGVQPGDYTLISVINIEDIVESIDYNNIAKSMLKIIKSSALNYESIETTPILYPNPASDFIRIDSFESVLNYSIINSLGAVMMQGNLLNMGGEIDIQELPSGVYLILIKTDTRELIKKFEVY